MLEPLQQLSTISMGENGSLRNLAGWIIGNRDRFADMSLAEVAVAANVSETTVFRLARKIGFSGFREMRVALAEIRGIAKGQALLDASESDRADHPHTALILNTARAHKCVLDMTVKLLDPDALEAAIHHLSECRVAHLIGFGSSEAPISDLYQRLLRFGLLANKYHDPHFLASITANPPTGSLFLAVSYSGQSRDVVDALESASNRSLVSILITSNPSSVACRHASIVLRSAARGAVPGSESAAPLVSQFAIIEMICNGLALEHPRKSEFLRNSTLLEEEIEKKRVMQADRTPLRRSLTA